MTGDEVDVGIFCLAMDPVDRATVLETGIFEIRRNSSVQQRLSCRLTRNQISRTDPPLHRPPATEVPPPQLRDQRSEWSLFARFRLHPCESRRGRTNDSCARLDQI